MGEAACAKSSAKIQTHFSISGQQRLSLVQRNGFAVVALKSVTDYRANLI